jgi:hypothetical protein
MSGGPCHISSEEKSSSVVVANAKSAEDRVVLEPTALLSLPKSAVSEALSSAMPALLPQPTIVAREAKQSENPKPEATPSVLPASQSKGEPPSDRPSGSQLSAGQPSADAAGAKQKELVQALVLKRDALAAKAVEVQAAEAEKTLASKRINEAEDAARPEATKALAVLATAKTNLEGIAKEAATVKAAHFGFMQLQDVPAAKAKQGAAALKPQLKLIGLEKDVIEALPAALAKDKKKRSAKDKKVISSAEEALSMNMRARATFVVKCKADVKLCEEGVNATKLASEGRAREIANFDLALKGKETAKKACEEAISVAERELAGHERWMTEQGLMRFSSMGEQCAICCDDVPAGEAVMLGCGHGWYCPECVTRFVEARLDIGTAGDIPCPDCAKPISELDLVKLLPKNVVFKLHARSIEQKSVASGAIPRACPTPDCPMRMTLDNDSAARQTCPCCNVESCWLCGVQPYHEGLTCEEHSSRKRAENADEEAFFPVDAGDGLQAVSNLQDGNDEGEPQSPEPAAVGVPQDAVSQLWH